MVSVRAHFMWAVAAMLRLTNFSHNLNFLPYY